MSLYVKPLAAKRLNFEINIYIKKETECPAEVDTCPILHQELISILFVVVVVVLIVIIIS